VEKPAPGTAPSNLINAGTYVFEPSVLSRIPTDRKVSIERETFPQLVADRTLFAMSTDDYWIDTGRPATYSQANFDVLDGVRATLRCTEVASGARVDPSASIKHSLISAGASVGSKASVTDSIVIGGAAVSEGAVVTGSIVMGRVGSGATVADCVIGADGVVESGARLSGALVPDPNVTNGR
jgi:mannose-1-phosphate guanylyltransferase